MEDNNLLSDSPKEVKRFNWTINSFGLSFLGSQIYNGNPTQTISVEFGMGEALGLTSTWKMSLRPKPGLRDTTTIFLDVARIRGEPEAKYFSCRASVKKRQDPSQDLISIEFSKDSSKEFGNLQEMLKATIGNDLTIHVIFVFFAPKCGTTPTGIETLPGGREALAEDYGKLLESGDNADFVIKVKDDSGGDCAEFKVHKNILGARSGVFQSMLSSGMTEAETGTLVIKDLSPACVKIILKFIYTGNLDDSWKNVAKDMIRAADKYNLQLLLNFLDRRLHVVCTFANAMQLRRLAKLHELNIAIKNINKFIASNIDQIGY